MDIPPELIPLFLRAAMAQAPQGQQFPDAPPSRADAAYEQSLARWHGLGEAAKNDPASVVGMFGMPGAAAETVLRAKDASDRRPQMGMMPLGAPRKREDASIPEAAQPTAGQEPPAPPADVLPVLLQQKTELQKQIDAASKARDLEAKSGSGPKWQAAVNTANGLIEKMKALDDQIGSSQAERTAASAAAKRQAFASDPKTIEAENVRSEMLANRTKPFRDAAPEWLLNAMPWGPAVVAAGTHAAMNAVDVAKNRTAAGKWAGAIEAADKAKKIETKSKFGDISAGYAKEYPKEGGLAAFKPYGYAMGAGALEGGAVANSPEMYDWWRQPDLNPERAAYEEYLKRLPADHPERQRVQGMINAMPQGNPIKEAAANHFLNGGVWARLGTGAYEGAAGATLGKGITGTFNPTFPRPEASALAKELRKMEATKKAADAAKAEKASAKAASKELAQPAISGEILPPGGGAGAAGAPPPSGYGFTPSQMNRLLDDEAESVIGQWHAVREPVPPGASEMHKGYLKTAAKNLDEMGYLRAGSEDELRSMLAADRMNKKTVQPTRPDVIEGNMAPVPQRLTGPGLPVDAENEIVQEMLARYLQPKRPPPAY